MPYANEHAARLLDPKQFTSFRRENDAFGSGRHAIYGIKNGKAKLQAIRFDASKHTVAAAKKWLADHGYKPILFEPASKKGQTMSDYHERTIVGDLRAEQGQDGLISGVLATDGEASDGDILHIPGGTVNPGMPLLFGHDTLPIGDALRNLGSWTSFQKSDHEIRGTAKIETDVGEGKSLEFRRDVAAMIAAGHISGLSIRWEPTTPPVRRVNLPADHYAHVDDQTEKDPRKRFGYFFPKWRGLEGSVVTLGADKQAMIGRAIDFSRESSEVWNDIYQDLTRDEIREELLEQLRGFEPVAYTATQLGLLLLERLDAGEEIPAEILIRLAGGDDPPSDGAEPAPALPISVKAPTAAEIAEALREAAVGFRNEARDMFRKELARVVGDF